MQSQKAVSAYFTSKQILPFGFAEHYTCGHCVVIPCYNAVVLFDTDLLLSDLIRDKTSTPLGAGSLLLTRQFDNSGVIYSHVIERPMCLDLRVE